MEELNEKLNKINNIKGQIKDSIVNKKGTITDETPFEDYPKAIDELPSGEGGEKVFAHYVDTDIAEGKKVMMTRTTNQAVPDTEFCNGYRPYIINDGLAYCSTTTTTGATDLRDWTTRQIVDGKISDDFLVPFTSGVGLTGLRPFCQSCLNGKSVIFGCYGNITDYDYIAPSNVSIFTGNGRVSMNVGSFWTNITEHYYVYSGKSGDFPYAIYLPPLQTSGASPSRITLERSYGARPLVAFERENENGNYVYALRSSSQSEWKDLKLLKYDRETNEVTSELTFYSIETTQMGRGHIFVQTKDYKYVIHPNGYIYLNYPFEGVETGFAFREYPQQIKDAIGDRTVLTVQAYYDNYFALMLSDGSTLMCHYNWDIIPLEKVNTAMSLGGDYLAVCDVEEIEPFKIPNDNTIYQRLYSGDRLFWFLSTMNKVYPAANKNPAGQFDQENNTSSWFATEPNKDRFNSTVLTGFMTGESKTENGRQLVEVKTVTA